MPIMKDKLVDTDTRWEYICCSVDDRSPKERKAGGLLKSRYSPINYFISNDERNVKGLNDNKYTINIWARKMITKRAKELGVEIDKTLINHLSYLLVRESLCVFEGKVDDDDENITNHFEAFQSSNWNDVRFKPPPSMDSSIGWRTEFRTIDSQITYNQNFLFTHAVLIMGRLLGCKELNLNFYIPISKVNCNYLI